MSEYPTSIDTDSELFLVHDSLRVKLVEDYNPGDVSVTIDDTNTLARFPSTGIITLTEQCNFDPTLRAISFSYAGKSATGFVGLQLLDGFVDVAKPKRSTNVTMNVFADHHNSLKDALINIEGFAGKKGEISLTPLTGTMEARINYLRKLVLKPKAWLTVSNRVGIVPFTVNIKDLSLRAPTRYVYDFGDSTTQTLNFAFVPGQAEGTADVAPTPGDVTKVYTTPGVYDLTLTVTNSYGTDTIVLPSYIEARTSSPDAATITFAPLPTQQFSGGVLRTKASTPVDVSVATTGEQISDPIVSYNWNLSDDVPHSNSPNAEGLWSLGGVYDIVLRTNSTFGSFRITTFPNVVDVVEATNVWLAVFDPTAPTNAVTKNLQVHEFGILSETFKIRALSTLSVSRNPAFLTGQPSEARQKKEFLRNNGFTPRTLISSGDQGSALMYWSEGAADYSSTQVIRFAEYNGFTDLFSTPIIGGTSNYFARSWNWLSLNSPSSVYFLFGTRPGGPQDLTDLDSQVLDLTSLTVGGQLLKATSFQNGADEMMSNVGDGTDGEFSVYRTCWKDSTGFISRNDGTGQYFRIKSFYRTEGVLGDPVRTIRKLPDIPGDTKHEGQLVALSNGIYFFNNTGEVAAYNPTTNVWSTGGPGIGSPAFSSLQDSTVSNFDSSSNSLIAAGDGNHNAYLSFDYSNSAFLKFSELDLTFSKMPNRPPGEQFNMTAY